MKSAHIFTSTILFLLIQQTTCFLKLVEPSDKENSYYQLMVPNKSSQFLFYKHDKGFTNCTISLEFFSQASNNEELEHANLVSQVQILNPDQEEIFSKWYKVGEDFENENRNVSLPNDGIYVIKVSNLDSYDLDITLLSGFHQCSKHQKYLNKTDIGNLNQKLEGSLDDLYKHLGSFTESFVSVERRQQNIKSIKKKMIIGIIGEILAIILVAWWQIFYLINSLEKKMVV